MNTKEQVILSHPHNYQINFSYCRIQTNQNQFFISEIISNSFTMNEHCTEKKKRPMNPYFWYSREEPEHVKMIISYYTNFLQIDKDRAKNSRCPIQFIGRIKRVVVPNTEKLQTFDEVSIHRRDALPLGSLMPLVKQVYCKTTWSSDGLPIKLETVKRKDDPFKLYSNGNASYLYCLPVFSSDYEFQFFSSTQFQNVTYADLFNILLHNCHLESLTKQFFKEKRKQDKKKQNCISILNDNEDEVSDSSSSDSEEEEEEDDDDFYDNDDEDDDDKLFNDLCESLENECSLNETKFPQNESSDLSYILSSPSSLISAGFEIEFEMEFSSNE